MSLRVKYADGSIIVYREKWGAIAYQLAIGCVCIFIAIYFYMIGAAKAPTAFLVIFCGMFSLGGAAVLVRLPRQAKLILSNDGAQILHANASGISLTPYLGGLPRYDAWSVLSELILADTFNVIYADGDSDSYRCRLIVVFKPDAHQKGHWLNEFGSGVAKSGEERAYLLGEYPRQSREQVHHALKRLVPNTLPIRLCRKVEFNRKSGKDCYTEA